MVSGASTLRVSPLASKKLSQQLLHRLDSFNRVHFRSFSCHGWVGIWTNLISAILFFAVGLFALRLRKSVLPGVLTILLTTCIDVLTCIISIVDALADMQRGLNCVERLDYYANKLGMERQEGRECPVDATWPVSGGIEMHNLSVRYRPNLPLALRDFNLSIKGGQKIGIVGRTGAGKSTIFSVLLGFTDPFEGSIKIDGVDISEIGVRDLREAMAVIPQEPTLFGGTVRTNLDPRNECSDEELWSALRQTGLTTQSPSATDGKGDEKQPQMTETHSTGHRSLRLSSHIAPGGHNLSSGQRQLLSLARAIVRNKRIILVDEATASIDNESDLKIQAMLQSVFADRTVLVVAHRIHTVKNYDRIAVIDAGRVVEFGKPKELWDRDGGLFKELCEKSGIHREQLGQ